MTIGNKQSNNSLSNNIPGRRRRAETGTIGSVAGIYVDTIGTIQNQVLDYRDVSQEQLVFMTRNDGQARAILNSIVFPIKLARPRIKAAPGGEKEAEFIRQNFLGVPAEGGMSIPLSRIIAQMALAVRDGYKIFEKVWKIRNGVIYLDKLAFRSTSTTNFIYDDHGNIIGARQETTFQNKYYNVKWGLDKIAFYIYNAEENPYVGESAFYPVFYHYDKKHKLYAIAHLAYQLNALPIRIGKHPLGMHASVLEEFRNNLKKMGSAMVMTMPNTCEVDKFESSRSLSDFLPLIRHHDSMMSRAFLAQFLNLGQEGRGGSFALSENQSDLFLMALVSILEEIANVFNTQVIPQLIDWNFGTGKYPKVVFSPFSDILRSAVADTFKVLMQARNPQVTPEFVLKIEEAMAEELGLELDYRKIQERLEEERKALIEGEGKSTVANKNVAPEAEDSDDDIDIEDEES